MHKSVLTRQADCNNPTEALKTRLNASMMHFIRCTHAASVITGIGREILDATGHGSGVKLST